MKKITSFFCILVLSLGTSLSTQARFSDEGAIPQHALYPIKILKQKNIISGNADGSFRPYASVNRAEFCKILVNAIGIETYIPSIPTFPDVESGDWFYEYVETAKYYGWVRGYPDGSFRPGGKINRAEVAKILTSAFNFEAIESPTHTNWYDKYIRTLKNKALLPHGVDGDDFKAAEFPSRVEVSEQIYRFMINAGKLTSYDLILHEEEEETEQTSTPESQPESNEQGDNTSSTSDNHTNNTANYPSYYDDETTNNTETQSSDTESNASQQDDVPTPPPTEIDDQVTVDVLIDKMPITDQAGTLLIKKNDDLPLKITIRRDHKNLLASSLQFTATGGNVRLGGLQFRHIGNGDYDTFSKAWVVIGGQRVTSKIMVSGDILAMNFGETITIPSGSTKSVDLYMDLSGKGDRGDSSRFVLYLPDWINANTNSKVGFFPFGGIDLEIK